jgi:23S rRNA (uracil1939-C5)-methyltransferase
MNQQPSLKKGDSLSLQISSLAFGGAGVGRHGDLVIFVDQALPGQTVQAVIIKKKKNFAEARLQAVISPSPFQQVPVCSHFGSCGGCRLQHLQYATQLAEKSRQVEESLQHIGGFVDLQMQAPLAAPELFFYRNKMEFSFSDLSYLPKEQFEQSGDSGTGLYLGLHAKGFFNKVIDVAQCHLLTPIANDILAAVRQFAKASGLPVYSSQSHAGFWRFLVMRHAKHTGQLMVNLVTYEYDENIAAGFKQMMLTSFPQITSLLFSTTQNVAGVAFSEQEHVLHGPATIREHLGPLCFDISSNSFFQTNTLQAERLYDVVADWAQIQPHERVYDLYCGAGTISLYVSQKAKEVIGFESVAAAVADAQRNCILNDVRNCRFVLGDLRDQLNQTEETKAAYGQPHVMIIDPPRSGMHPKTVQAVLRLQPKRIVHVSCNPASLARDLQILCESAYTLVRVKAVDMFPHTSHIEVVAELHFNESKENI